MNDFRTVPWAVKNGIAIALLPKAGSTSFRQCLDPFERVSNKDVLSIDQRILFLREPLLRLISAYSFFYYLNERDMNGRNTRSDRVKTPVDVTHNGWEVWVDFALENPDPHWMPQIELTGGVHTAVHRFTVESIHENWPKYFPGLLPGWVNAVSKLPATDYRSSDIREYYADDFSLYAGIK